MFQFYLPLSLSLFIFLSLCLSFTLIKGVWVNGYRDSYRQLCMPTHVAAAQARCQSGFVKVTVSTGLIYYNLLWLQ